MSETLLSVGLDVGTTTTQLILSRLTVENRASAFSVPEMEITRRQILYKSPVQFTPLIRDELVDGPALKNWVAEQYDRAGMKRQEVDTGAVIITGRPPERKTPKRCFGSCRNLPGTLQLPPQARIWKVCWPPRVQARWHIQKKQEKPSCIWTSVAAPATWPLLKRDRSQPPAVSISVAV